MPQLYYLNPPPNPFWDFVTGLEDHPFFQGMSPHAQGRFRGQPSATQDPAPGAETDNTPPAEKSENARGKQPTVEDPPEVDPATLRPEPPQAEGAHGKDFPFRGRGRFGKSFGPSDDEGRRGHGGHPCRGRRTHAGWNGPPPFVGGHPFFARPPWAQHGPPPPPGHEHRGPPGPPGPQHHPHHPPPHMRGGHRGCGRRGSPPHGIRPGFDLSEFLNKLGDKLGVDISGAAEGLGLTADRFTAGRTGQDVNFEPRTDIFENKDLYTIHLSLPGAKKSDIGVDYDGENSVLRVTGVVHRLDADEQMLSELVVDGRKRETGVFEKAIRLGTKRDPANIDVAAIGAKMTDGVLVVKVPKLEKVHEKREVPITTDAVAEGKADYEDDYSEKPVLFDADEQASVAGTEHKDTPKRGEISLMDMNQSELKEEKAEKLPIDTAVSTTKEQEAKQESKEAQASTKHEQLPPYAAHDDHDESDWEKFSDASGEGEYIKINVD